MGKLAPLAAFKVTDSPPILRLTPRWAEPGFTVRFVARRNEPTRSSFPDFILGRGLRTLAPPSDVG